MIYAFRGILKNYLSYYRQMNLDITALSILNSNQENQISPIGFGTDGRTDKVKYINSRDTNTQIDNLLLLHRDT